MDNEILRLTNDQAGRKALFVDFLEGPFVGPQVFQAMLATKRQVFGGDNIFRDGADLVATKRENAGLQIETGFLECSSDRMLALKAKIERLCEQARLRNENGWGPKVELQWRLAQQGYTRYADIIDGDLDVPTNWLRMETPGHLIKPGDCTLSLLRKPYWREDEEILENFVENPSFLLTVGGYPAEAAFGFDAWDISGGATAGVDATNWIQGGQSIYVVCPNFAMMDSGIGSEDIALVADTWYYVEAWIWHRGGNRITMRLHRVALGPPWLTPVAWWTPGFNIMPVIDEQGTIMESAWREPGFIRKGFVFRAPLTDDYRIQIGVTLADDVGGETHFDVDRIYLTEAVNLNWAVGAERVLDPTTDWKEVHSMPRAWCSGRDITEHTDRGDCAHGGDPNGMPGMENHIAYWDVEDVPGNLKAPMDLEIQLISIGKQTEYPGGGGYPNVWHDWYIGRKTQGDLENFVWDYPADQLDDLGGTFALVADTYAPNCERAQGAVGAVDWIAWYLSNIEDMYGTYRAYLLAYATLDPSNIRARISQTLNFEWQEYVSIVGIGPFYRIHNLGLLDFPGMVEPELAWDLVTYPPRILLEMRRDAGAAILRIAGLVLIPVSESSLFVSSLAYSVGQGDGMMAQQIDKRKSVFWIRSDRTAYRQLAFSGAPISLMPRQWNRLISLSGIRENVYFPGTSYLYPPALMQRLRARYQPRFL